MPSNKQRVDTVLVAKGLAADLSQAKRLLMAGLVLVDNQPVDKAGVLIETKAIVRLKGRRRNYVSRGGDKLAGALADFSVNPAGRTVIDLGASTGGFTDCLLQAGADKVFAVDVGTNQLDFRLRGNSKVISLEQTHARDLTINHIPEPAHLLVADVSFTSLRYVLPFVFPFLKPKAEIVCLFKPQFEAPKTMVGPGGIIRESSQIEPLMQAWRDWCDQQGWRICGLKACQLKGRKGNQEYFYHLCSKDLAVD